MQESLHGEVIGIIYEITLSHTRWLISRPKSGLCSFGKCKLAYFIWGVEWIGAGVGVVEPATKSYIF